jgi:hypothetical protein
MVDFTVVLCWGFIVVLLLRFCEWGLRDGDYFFGDEFWGADTIAECVKCGVEVAAAIGGVVV